MRGFEETDASQYNMDEDRAGARKMIFSKRSGRHKTNSFKGVRNNQVLNQTKISTDPSWQGLPYDDSKFIGWHYGLAANDHRFRYGSWESLSGRDGEDEEDES